MINSKIVKSNDSFKEFPKLMQGENGVVVLMTGQNDNQGEGFLISKGFENKPVGYHSIAWNLEVFKDFKGSVELFNRQGEE